MRFPEYFREQNLPFRDNRGKVSPEWDQKAGIVRTVIGSIGLDRID
jgi:hypothetical protein